MCYRKGENQMLKTMEFAQLVHTTRRTLIFYDEKGLFKPAITSSNGYRYYEYNQVYLFELITSLRKSGLSLNQINSLLNDKDKEKLVGILNESASKLKDEIGNLQNAFAAIQNRINDLQESRVFLTFNHPQILTCNAERFFCSDMLEACAPKEMAINYTNFSKELTDNKLLISGNGGFLTNLDLSSHQEYRNASFRFIQTSFNDDGYALPQLVKPSGRYLVIKVKNNNAGIMTGLVSMHNYAKTNHIKTVPNLWQFNTSFYLEDKGASSHGILQYQIIEKAN